MTSIEGQKADVHFGKVPDNTELDMGFALPEDPDDEELEETPSDVVAVLGFDPKDA
jgi:hypothetical protein